MVCELFGATIWFALQSYSDLWHAAACGGEGRHGRTYVQVDMLAREKRQAPLQWKVGSGKCRCEMACRQRLEPLPLIDFLVSPA